jgi:hypothetical protein
MLDLVEQPGRNWAVKHQVSLEQLYLLDRLPPFYGRRARSGPRLVMERVLGLQLTVVARVVFVVIEWVLRIWPVRVRTAYHGPPIVVLPVVVGLCAKRMRALVVR